MCYIVTPKVVFCTYRYSGQNDAKTVTTIREPGKSPRIYNVWCAGDRFGDAETDSFFLFLLGYATPRQQQDLEEKKEIEAARHDDGNQRKLIINLSHGGEDTDREACVTKSTTKSA